VFACLFTFLAAGLFGLISFRPALAAHQYLEAAALWILPVATFGVIVRFARPLWVRMALVFLLVGCLAFAEYVGILARPISDLRFTIPVEQLYSSATIYLIIGPLQLFLFLSVLVFSEKEKTRKIFLFMTSVFLLVSAFFFISEFADARPFFLSSATLWILLESCAYIGSVAYLLRRWMPWRGSFLLSIVSVIAAIIPSSFS
ncbi:MAG: hypothetical protein V1685_03680, partial [Parcubacteria group bacterium]